MWEWRPFEHLVEVDIIVAKIADFQSVLAANEATIVSNSVPSRVREFTAGRSLARSLLSRRDIHPKSIMAGDGGQPLWPTDIAGSISHTDEYVAAAIAARRDVASIGIDVELTGGAGALDSALILTAVEQQRAATSSIDDYVTRAFCCKEAVFKAVYPLTATEFEFLDIDIAFDAETFTASLQRPGEAATIVARGRGTFATKDSIYAAVFLL